MSMHGGRALLHFFVVGRSSTHWSPMRKANGRFIINVSLLGESVGCVGILSTSEGVLRVLFFGPMVNTGLVYAELLALKIRVDVFIEAGYESDRDGFGI
ncbi:hypothetical protein V6N13_034178 [Hibiscus sabdariffa]